MKKTIIALCLILSICSGCALRTYRGLRTDPVEFPQIGWKVYSLGAAYHQKTGRGAWTQYRKDNTYVIWVRVDPLDSHEHEYIPKIESVSLLAGKQTSDLFCVVSQEATWPVEKYKSFAFGYLSDTNFTISGPFVPPEVHVPRRAKPIIVSVKIEFSSPVGKPTTNLIVNLPMKRKNDLEIDTPIERYFNSIGY
ncbi:MAG: hypothetical protein AB7U43_10860 [Desulfobacter sp.]